MMTMTLFDYITTALQLLEIYNNNYLFFAGCYFKFCNYIFN